MKISGAQYFITAPFYHQMASMIHFTIPFQTAVTTGMGLRKRICPSDKCIAVYDSAEKGRISTAGIQPKGRCLDC